MSSIAIFTFNPFSENTYIIYDETKECVIIDPGCYTQQERDQLKAFIEKHDLRPVRLLNTHCHLDHIFGNRFVADTYGLKLEIHEGELAVLDAAPTVAKMYGVYMPQPSPAPGAFIAEGDEVSFGNTRFQTLLTPGHSPASICFYNAAEHYVIAGDVLFQGSIGRTDLPGGNHKALLKSIREKLFVLPDETKVYPGHGDSTTIGIEKTSNPFF